MDLCVCLCLRLFLGQVLAGGTSCVPVCLVEVVAVQVLAGGTSCVPVCLVEVGAVQVLAGGTSCVLAYKPR